MKNRTLNDYLPKKDANKVLIQAKIGSDLHALVKAAIDSDDITIQDLVVASLKRYLDERKAS
jgi:hypothetical protein